MTTFHIPDMSCGHCKATVENAVRDVDAEAVLTFDMPNRSVEIQSQIDGTRLQAVLSGAGYPSKAVKTD